MRGYAATMKRSTTAGALGFLGMGALALASPRSVAGVVDIGVESEMTENEIRSVYGGFGIAMGIGLAYEGLRGRPGAVHRVCALALTGMAAGRIADLAIRNGEGDIGRPATLAGIESLSAVGLFSATLGRRSGAVAKGTAGAASATKELVSGATSGASRTVDLLVEATEELAA